MEGPRLLDVLLVGVAAARPRRLDGLGVDAQRPPPPPPARRWSASARCRTHDVEDDAPRARPLRHRRPSRSVASWTRLLRAKLVR